MSERRLTSTALLLSFLSLVLFSLFSAQGIYGGDSGDLVTAAFLGGVPHPPGYPLYTFLGWFISHLPVLSVSWRVGLLSSLSHALVVGLVFLYISRLTKSWIPGLYGALALVGNYLFFLYAVTPEVFALLDLFLILLLYLLLSWDQTKNKRYLFLTSFVFGLSLTHHQVILFLVPAIAYYLWINRKFLSVYQHLFIRLFAYFIVGLSPYLYIPLAASGGAIINWDRAVNLSGFVRLVGRADYGTFVSGGFYGTQLISRLLQLKAYAELVATDLTWVGIILSALGVWWCFRRLWRLLIFLFTALIFLGPVFFFYASFPLLNRFNMGTYERFLLPSYIIFYILIGLGFWQAVLVIDQHLKKRLSIWPALGRPVLILVFFLYPSVMLGVTSWKFIGLPTDRTAENLGRDILASLPPKAVLLLARDTPLFVTQYMRYVERVRPDLAVLHASLLSQESYPAVIGKNFPQLSLPASHSADFPLTFIAANRDRYPIFTNVPLGLDAGWFWIPHGLVYQLKSEKDLPSAAKFLEENRRLWSGLHDPRQGILARFNHLMLSDLRDVYASSRLEFGRILLKAGQTNEAQEQFEQALAYGGDTQVSDILSLLGLTELFLKHCDGALGYFQKAKTASPTSDKMISFYEGLTWRDCAGDAERAQQFFDEYEKLRKLEETPLR